MAIRALSVLATAAVLMVASTAWGQDAQGESDASSVSDAALGEGGTTFEEDAAPVDAGDADDGSAAGADSSVGATDAGNPFGPGFPDVIPGIPLDAAFPSNPGFPSVPGFPTYPGIPTDADVPTFPGSPIATATAPSSTGMATDQPPASDDSSGIADDASSDDGGAQVAEWGDAAPVANALQTAPDPYTPVIGCGGCSTGDTGTSDALTMVFAAIALAWRARRINRARRTKGG
jgi:hypothetical protein